MSNSIVIVDGDFTGATGIDNCLLIVRGNVGRVNGIDNCLLIVHGNIGGVTEVSNSIILATGNFEGATVCNDSFLQVNNQRIRFTASRDSVLINTIVKTTAPTTSRVLDTDKGPLRLLRFGPRKLDDQLTWGKEVNSLTLAITPADQKDRYQLRWKNVGKEALELSWVRFNSDFVDKNRDDLLNHVFLKGQDGKLALSRNYPPERATRRRSCVVVSSLGRARRMRKRSTCGPMWTGRRLMDAISCRSSSTSPMGAADGSWT